MCMCTFAIVKKVEMLTLKVVCYISTIRLDNIGIQQWMKGKCRVNCRTTFNKFKTYFNLNVLICKIVKTNFNQTFWLII